MRDHTLIAGPGTGVLTQAAAEGWIPRTCFKHGPPGQLGTELELILTGTGSEPADGLAPLRAALARLPVRGQVSIEPGGQIELSSDPAPDLVTALRRAHHDVTALRSEASRRNGALIGIGVDPTTAPRRLLRQPRYDAMEAFFDRNGPAGRTMMRATASVQVTVEAGRADGGPDSHRLRWEVLHAAGPALVAAFANSPLALGRPTGWCSTRQAVWSALDPYRTREPVVRAGETLEQAWTRWCLDAPVMLVRRPHGPWHAPAGLTFRRWIAEGRRAAPDHPGPTLEDLAYHLTTLFPPVRARGPYEVRYLDAQPGDWWQAPVAVLAAVTDDLRAADEVLEACEGVRGSWLGAARQGMRSRRLAAAATRVLEVAVAALRRAPDTAAAADVVEQFAEHWTLRGRSPADDVLDGRAAPPAPPPVPPVPPPPGGAAVAAGTCSREEVPC